MTLVDPFTGYELCADVYDTVPNPLLSLEERKLLPWLGSLKEQSVADVGCGTGRWMQRAQDLGAKSVVGLDFSPNMLKCAAQKPGLKGRVVLANAASLPLKTCSMDCLICGFALSYFANLDGAALEFNRILKSRGSLFCSDLHPSAHLRGWKRSFKTGVLNVEVESISRTDEEIIACLDRHFHLERHENLQFGESERAVFERAGKLEVFEQTKNSPAVILFQWRKR